MSKNEQVEIERLRKLLRDALPNIECQNNFQSGLISAIGKYLESVESKKPTCSTCEGSGEKPDCIYCKKNMTHTQEECDAANMIPCPDCPKPKEDVAEFVDTCPSYMGQGKCNEAEDYAKLEAENKELKAIIESQERNAAASEILIGDLTKKIEGMEAKDGQK